MHFVFSRFRLTSEAMFDILYIMSMAANISDTRPYGEKAAFVALAAMGIPFIPYFTWMSIHPPIKPMPDWDTFITFVAALATQVVIWTLGTVWIRKNSPEDARAPADERDIAISRRSIQTGYSVLVAGMVINIGCVFPFTSGGWKLINTGIAMVVLAELVRDVVAIWCYRRGWND